MSKWLKAVFKEQKPRRQYWNTSYFSFEKKGPTSFEYFSDAIENLVNDKAARLGTEGAEAAESAEEVDNAKLWVPLHDAGTHKQRGKLLVSIELVPEEEKEKLPAGWGRKEPNANPFLPKPPGRIRFSWNPFFLIRQFLGPKLCRRLQCLLCVLLCILILYYVIPVFWGNLLWQPFANIG